MAVDFYMDHHLPRPVTSGLRRRGVSVVTAAADGADRIADPDLLDRATELGRVLVTQDEDLLAEARHRQAAGRSFGGVIYAHQRRVSIGVCISDLELIAKAMDLADLQNLVTYLPL